MPSRRTFLGGASALAIGVGANAPAETVAAGRPATEAAFAQARAMRVFDPQLTDAQIAAIAHGIESAAENSAARSPRVRRLRNGDAP